MDSTGSIHISHIQLSHKDKKSFSFTEKHSKNLEKKGKLFKMSGETSEQRSKGKDVRTSNIVAAKVSLTSIFSSSKLTFVMRSFLMKAFFKPFIAFSFEKLILLNTFYLLFGNTNETKKRKMT